MVFKVSVHVHFDCQGFLVHIYLITCMLNRLGNLHYNNNSVAPIWSSVIQNKVWITGIVFLNICGHICNSGIQCGKLSEVSLREWIWQTTKALLLIKISNFFLKEKGRKGGRKERRKVGTKGKGKDGGKKKGREERRKGKRERRREGGETNE